MAKRNRQYLDATYHAELEDGTVIKVPLIFRDTLRYEAMEKRSPLAGVAQDQMISMSAVSRLVWIGARRLGLSEHRRYDDFERAVVDLWEDEPDTEEDGADVEPDDTDDEGGVILPDPTQSEPTDD